MKNNYDVVVIGAGPAGALFAAELARGAENFSILIVDGCSESNPKVCGGLLSPDAQKVLSKLNLTLPNKILSDPQIFDVATIDLCSKIRRNYQRHYLNMDRYAFDKWLISNIPTGVDVFNGRCTDLRADNGLITVKLCGDGGALMVSARYIVGADGANSIVRRSFFNTKVRKYVAIQQHFKCDDELLPPYSCIFDPVTSKSCSWTILKDGYAIFGGAFDKKDCRRAFELQKRRFEEFVGVDFGEPIRTEACLVTSPERLRDFVVGQNNVFLVGEAAGFISASSFEGISNAMISAKCLADAFIKGKAPEKILKLYKKNTLGLKLKLVGKIFKRNILCSPMFRFLIMKSGIKSVKKFNENV